MATLFTYRQDTAKSINYNNVLQESVSKRQEVKTEQQKKTYTPEQIRRWRNQQENKMLIDSTKFIITQNDFSFNTTQLVNEIVLPNRERNHYNTDWLTVIIFVGIVAVASIRYNYAKYIEHLFLSLFNYPTSMRMLKEKNYPITHAAYRLRFIFYLALSTFLYQFLHVFKWENTKNGFIYFLIIACCILLYYSVKKFLYQAIGALFEGQEDTNEFLFNLNNHNQIIGLFLLPITILISFAPLRNPIPIMIFGAICILFFNILLLRRGFSILLKKQFPIIYMFLYLCTLEILPLLLIYKVVV